MWALTKTSRQQALEHSQLESVILERTAELQILSQRLLKVQDEERRRLSRDLHDSTGQTLTALKISLASLEMKFNQDPATLVLLAEVSELADQAISEIRTMSYLLHPPLLDEVGLACAAEWYVEGFAKRSGVSVTLDCVPNGNRLPTSIEIALFRVLQESLTNVQRHSGAESVHVSLKWDLEKVVLEVNDDGRGIAADRLNRLRETSADSGVGFAGMRERMRELYGALEIESLGRGLSLRATIPTSEIAHAARLEDLRQGPAFADRPQNNASRGMVKLSAPCYDSEPNTGSLSS
jgi:signal transduction histidine kinase